MLTEYFILCLWFMQRLTNYSASNHVRPVYVREIKIKGFLDGTDKKKVEIFALFFNHKETNTFHQ